MSIAVLKRKTMNGNPRIAPISGSATGPLGFALNGTRRLSGSVGPTNLAPKGNANSHGQHYGVSCCTEDIDIVKPSVKNTKGMLSVRYKLCVDKCPKPIFQLTERSQAEYIHEKHVKYAGCDLNNSQPICDNKCKQKFIGGKNVFKGNYTKTAPGAISQAEYIKGKFLKDKAFLQPPCKPHHPPMVNNNGCN